MSRTGTRPSATKTNYTTLAGIPAGQKASAAEFNWLIDKAQNPQNQIAFNPSVKADDEYVFADHTQIGVINFVKDATVQNNIGSGNGISGIIIANGNAINFSADFDVSYPSSYINGQRYMIEIVWGGLKFKVHVKKVGEETIAGGVSEETTFDDSVDIVVDETVQYSTIRTVTGSTHTITAATTGNVIDQYKLVRYTFDIDCDLTLSGFDTLGSTLGTVNPIPAGTYNFWFYATAFGVGLVIQNNTGTTPGTLSTPVIILSAGNASLGYIISAIDTNATSGVLEYSTDNTNWTSDEDYSFGVNTGTMDGLVNGTLYYVRFRVSASGYLPSAYATDNETPSIAVTKLTAPTANAPTVNSDTEITFTCNDPNSAPQESTVLFRRADNSGMSTNLVTSQQASGTTSHQWTGLTPETQYYFDVIAQGNGSTTSNSDPSTVVNATTDATVSEVPLTFTTYKSNMAESPAGVFECGPANNWGDLISNEIISGDFETIIDLTDKYAPTGRQLSFGIADSANVTYSAYSGYDKGIFFNSDTSFTAYAFAVLSGGAYNGSIQNGDRFRIKRASGVITADRFRSGTWTTIHTWSGTFNNNIRVHFRGYGDGTARAKVYHPVYI
jgi:hypothetical protein